MATTARKKKASAKSAARRPPKAKATKSKLIAALTTPWEQRDAPAEVTLEQFREAAKEYLRADENVKLYTKRRDAQKGAVRTYVDAHAAELEKGKSRGLVDTAVKWMLVPGAMRVDEDQGVAALTKAIAKARGDRKRILEACLKPTIDRDAWDRAKAVGFIDDELCEAYERGRSYSLKWSHTDQVSCPRCRAVANCTSKFCGACGADLTESPDYLK